MYLSVRGSVDLWKRNQVVVRYKRLMQPYWKLKQGVWIWSMSACLHIDYMSSHRSAVVDLNRVLRWRVFLSGELRPSTRVGHLWMVVLRHHHAVLRDFCLWVCRHVIRYHGGAGSRDPGTCWERTQGGCTGTPGRALSSLTPTWKHVHTVACWLRWLVSSFQTLWMSLIIHFQLVWSFEMNQASAAHGRVDSTISAPGVGSEACIVLTSELGVSRTLYFAHCTSVKPDFLPTWQVQEYFYQSDKENVLFPSEILKHVSIVALDQFHFWWLPESIIIYVEGWQLLDGRAGSVTAERRRRERRGCEGDSKVLVFPTRE